MSEADEAYDVSFIQLVISLQAAAMQQMGKVMSPITGKIERDLDMAKSSIDLLAMLQRKTEGNLNNEEKQLLDRALYELQMNYVDESKRPASETEAKESTESTDDSADEDQDAGGLAEEEEAGEGEQSGKE